MSERERDGGDERASGAGDGPGCGPGGCGCGDGPSMPRRVADGGAESAPAVDPAETTPGTGAIPPADFGAGQGHEPGDDLATDTEHCIRCGFCTNACPVFAETGWESVAPRGHANVINAYLEGELDDEAANVKENLDLCIKCKQCVAPCPPGVEIPKLVIRATEKYHEEEGLTLADRAFAAPRTLNALGSRAAPLSNAFGRFGPVRAAMQRALGIDARRSLPEFHRETLADWFADREPEPAAGTGDRRVALFLDCYVNYNDPGVGRAAVRVLERLGATVELVDAGCCGRAALSKGLVDDAEAKADAAVGPLVERVEAGWDVVAVEPSCAAMLADEYRDLFDDERVERLAEHSYELMEYLAGALEADPDALSFDPLEAHVASHSHCHAKHLGIDGAAGAVLRRVPGLEVDEPHVSCCGMAGSFGYQAEYYDLSMRIGERLFEQVRASGGDPVATGVSCRAQLADGLGVEPEHPVELVERSTRPAG